MSKKYFLGIIVILIVASAIVLRLKATIENQGALSKIEKNTIASVPVIDDGPADYLPATSSDEVVEIAEDFVLEGELASSTSGSQLEDEKGTNVLVISPQTNQIVTSPLLVKGRVSGAWFFEASLPIKLTDDQGQLIAQGYAMASGDWMTTDIIEFNGVLEFKIEEIMASSGYVVIAKDNPSGLAEYDTAVKMPIRFK